MMPTYSAVGLKAPVVKDQIRSRGTLKEGFQLISKNMLFFCCMQLDGNLVIYKGHCRVSSSAIWATGTNGKGAKAYRLKIQEDGNVVIYANKSPIWASATNGKGTGPYNFIMQEDGNLVLYDKNNSPTWASGTNQAFPPVPILPDRFVLGQYNMGTIISSPNRKYHALLQEDGNFVLYKTFSFTAANALWASGSHGKGVSPYHLQVQDDGNVVIYDSKSEPTWASDTYHKGTPPFEMIVQDDGNLVLYDAHRTPTWASDTYSKAYTDVSIMDRISSETLLYPGFVLASRNLAYYAVMQHDGNFVLYKSNDFKSTNAVWATGTNYKGKGPHTFKVQNDGNLVVYDKKGTPQWASDTWKKGSPPYSFIMQDDRNLVLYDKSGTPTWASGTNI
jgi:hypothetical protein